MGLDQVIDRKIQKFYVWDAGQSEKKDHLKEVLGGKDESGKIKNSSSHNFPIKAKLKTK